jgi:hypothetical protein
MMNEADPKKKYPGILESLILKRFTTFLCIVECVQFKQRFDYNLKGDMWNIDLIYESSVAVLIGFDIEKV